MTNTHLFKRIAWFLTGNGPLIWQGRWAHLEHVSIFMDEELLKFCPYRERLSHSVNYLWTVQSCEIPNDQTVYFDTKQEAYKWALENLTWDGKLIKHKGNTHEK